MRASYVLASGYVLADTQDKAGAKLKVSRLITSKMIIRREATLRDYFVRRSVYMYARMSDVTLKELYLKFNPRLYGSN